MVGDGDKPKDQELTLSAEDYNARFPKASQTSGQPRLARPRGSLVPQRQPTPLESQLEMEEVTRADGSKMYVPKSAMSQTSNPSEPASQQVAPQPQYSEQHGAAPAVHGKLSKRAESRGPYHITELFPRTLEHIDRDHLPIGGIGLKLGNILGFAGSKGFTASLDDVVRNAIFDLKPLNESGGYMFEKMEQIPQEHVEVIKEGMIPNLQAETYQDMMGKLSLVDGGLHWIGKAEITLMGFELRNFGKKENGKPTPSVYDRLVKVEQLLFGSEVVYVMHSLASMHGEEESYMRGAWNAVTNPYVDRLLMYLAGVNIGLPIVADIFKDGHPVDNLSEKFNDLFHEKFGKMREEHGADSGSAEGSKKNALINTLGTKYLTHSSGVAGKVSELYKEMTDDAKHPLLGSFTAFLGEESALLSLGGSLVFRGSHVAFLHYPFITEYVGRAIEYKVAKDVARIEYDMGK